MFVSHHDGILQLISPDRHPAAAEHVESSSVLVAGPDSVPEHEVQDLLKFKMRYGRPYVLVRWTGLDAAGDTWEPLDNLTNCEDAIAAFEQATNRSLPRPAPPLPTGTAVAPPPIPPTRIGFTVEAAARRRRPATWALRWWAGLGSTGGLTMAGSTAPSLASARAAPSRTLWPKTGRRRRCASSRCTARRTRSSTPPVPLTASAGCFSRRSRRRVWPEPFDPGPPTLSLSLVGGSSKLPALGREVIGHSHRTFCSLHLAVYIYGSNHGQR